MKSRSAPLMSSTGPWIFGSASKSGIGNGGGAFGSIRVTPELNTPIVFTRGSAARSIERKPPHELPITATLSTAILPFSGEPSRLFSLSAQSIAVRKSSTLAWRRVGAFDRCGADHEEAVRRDGRQEAHEALAVDRAAAVAPDDDRQRVFLRKRVEVRGMQDHVAGRAEGGFCRDLVGAFLGERRALDGQRRPDHVHRERSCPELRGADVRDREQGRGRRGR